MVRLNGDRMREKLEKIIKETEMKKNSRENKEFGIKVTNGKAS
ncbi:MAG TPA: hypothetical protein VMX77_02550 [Candidatus Bathyarchaeia archaeon]|nr:hypothetical protein [Candidatus Bathyarchaeia archaeon]